MRRYILSFVFLLAISCANSVSAGPWGRGMGPGGMYPPHAESELGLTQEQSEKLKNLRRAYLDEITSLQNRLFSRRAELRLLWSAKDPDKEQITLKQKEIIELERQIKEITTRHRLECSEVLTPEQRIKAGGFDGRRRMEMRSRSGVMHRGWNGGK